MKLDGIDIGLGNVVITDSILTMKDKKIPIKCIDIYDNKHEHRFTIYTMQEYHKYNDLELNKKTNVLNLIDDYDICFGTRKLVIINSRNNSIVYFTRIDNHKYIINAEIKDFDDCVFASKKHEFKNLKVEAIIDFN